MDYRRTFICCSEQPNPIKGHVIGEIPEWLRGRLFMNGPAKFEFGGFKVKHWFDGSAMIIKFNIDDEGVTFQSKFVESDAYKKANKHGKLIYAEFGTPGGSDPDRNLFGRVLNKLIPLELTDNVCSNLHIIKDELYASTESNFAWLIDQETLETKEKVDITKVVNVNVCSSHPHVSEDGTLYNIASSFMKGLKYHVIKIDPPNDTDSDSGRKAYRRGSVLFTVPSRWSTCYGYYHSFAITENHFIFMEQCLVANIPRLMASQIKGLAIKDCLQWKPEEKTRFVIMDRTNGTVSKTKYFAEPMFVFHHINSYEDDGHVIVDVIAFDNPEVTDMTFLDRLRVSDYSFKGNPQAKRFVLPIVLKETATASASDRNIVELAGSKATAILNKDKSVVVTPEDISEPGIDSPVIDYRSRNGAKYRFMYACSAIGPNPYNSSLVKIDLQTKEETVWKGPEGSIPLEASFVSRPDSTSEDDGILLSAVLNGPEDSNCFLVILDAKTMKEICRVEIPSSIPYCFHAHFVSTHR